MLAIVEILWSPQQLGNTTILGLTMDGNRVNQSNTAGGGAMMYVIGATRVKLRDTRTVNWRGDGLYVGGSTTSPFTGRSAFVSVINHESTGNYRNGMSVVGLDRGVIEGGIFNSTSNTNPVDGPQCGIDFEPNGSTSQNTNISVFGITASSNGGALATRAEEAGSACSTRQRTLPI